jgi:hypothetical protein
MLTSPIRSLTCLCTSPVLVPLALLLGDERRALLGKVQVDMLDEDTWTAAEMLASLAGGENDPEVRELLYGTPVFPTVPCCREVLFNGRL